MSRWFRFYADALRNPKVARLNDTQFRLWVELMAVAAENEGAIPCLDDLKHVLKRRLDHLSRGLKELISMGLMDPLDDGYEPHNWSKHQYKSDVSTNRVAKHRGKRNVSETPPETETETETEYLEPKGSCSSRDEPDEKPPAKQDQGDDLGLKPEHVVDKWNELAGRIGKPRVRDLTPERRVKLKARIAGYSVDDFRSVLGGIERSGFLRGDTGWHGCTFDWMTKKANFQKILEGNYE